MKQLFTLALFALIAASVGAQIVTDDSGKVFVDGKLYTYYKKEGCKMFSQTCMYTFRNLQHKPVLIVKQGTTTDPSEENNANKKGNLLYTDFVFLGSKQKGQIAKMSMRDEKVIKQLFKFRLFKDDDLDEQAASDFVLVNPVVYPLQQVIIKQQGSGGSSSGGNGINIKF